MLKTIIEHIKNKAKAGKLVSLVSQRTSIWSQPHLICQSLAMIKQGKARFGRSFAW
jgi:hypothetical protein